MDEKLKEMLKKIICEWPAIRCVRIGGRDSFLFEQIAGVDEEPPEEVIKASRISEEEIRELYGDVKTYCPPDDDPNAIPHCRIFHNNRIIDDKREIYRYLEKYEKYIQESPTILIDNLFQKKKIKINASPGYVKAIMNLFREIGVIEEKRGKIKKDEIKIKRNKFILKEYRHLKKEKKCGKRFPIHIIQKRWNDKLREEFPDDEKKYEKRMISDSTIRRILKRSIKK